MKLNIRKESRTAFLGFLLIVVSALPAYAQATATKQQEQEPADNVYQEGAVLWTQAAGEEKALCYQAFALARMVLDRDLRTTRRSRMPRAVVVDADETIIDNSPYQAYLVKNRLPYSSAGWNQWVNRAEAAAIPGAIRFLRYAASRGVRVFYITNRNVDNKNATAANLRKLGFPGVSDETLLVKTDPNSSSKEARRKSVSARYRIVLLMGDNLNDFAEVFEQSKSVESRLQAVERNRKEFGKRFIVLPNAMYGDWESAVYDYAPKPSDKEKAEKRRNRLKSYQ